MRKAASVFDLDHTLLSVNSGYHFGTFLYRKRKLSIFTVLRLISFYALHKYGGMSLVKLHQKAFTHLFQGHSLSQFQKWANDYLDEMLEGIIYPPGHRRFADAQKQKHHTVILSSSPHFLVEKIAKRLNADEWKGSIYQTNAQGELTEVSKIMDGDLKAKYVKKNLSPYYKKVYAYSDSILDLPFLETAAAVGVNPDRRLRVECQRRNWEII